MKLFLSIVLLLASEATDLQNTPPTLVPFRRGAKWGYADQRQHLVLPLQYDEAGPFADGVAWVRQGELFGYINATGTLVTPLHFTKASNFQQGRATVVLGAETFDIDPSGQRLNTPPAPAPEVDVLSQGHVIRQNGKLGYRFTVGDAIVPAEYDEIQETITGLLVVRQGQKWGAINGKGKRVLPVAYDAIRASVESEFPVVEQQGRFGYLAADGHLLVKPKYRAAEPFQGGVARVVTEVGQAGFIDTKGEEYFEE
ncbi:WG repeat-containing protein [Hymenobacter sp. GOD-10R]|uniref:WG repeat-containing protein n=1 Tax=Hymenobacter sp. GOD-10R TaxID=3093922 RepID=UPI002D782E54|nr:WG repeat-containing protein [Hymenobacter sp. GOD-10R]WRQ28901.1 WG repeat-containing protein [Hymenobacter sp. GOD-10R]